MFVIYSGIVLGVVGLVAAVGLWMMKTWSFWLTIVVCVLNILLNVSGLVMMLPAGLKALIAGDFSTQGGRVLVVPLAEGMR